MRNYPEWITSFQAIHSLGAISAAVNAWSPPETLVHCLKSSGSKIAIMDEERAKHLLPFKSQIQNSGCEAFFVVKKKVVGFESFEEATRACTGAAAPAVDIAPDVSCIVLSQCLESTLILVSLFRISPVSSSHQELLQCQKLLSLLNDNF